MLNGVNLVVWGGEGGPRPKPRTSQCEGGDPPSTPQGRWVEGVTPAGEGTHPWSAVDRSSVSWRIVPSTFSRTGPGTGSRERSGADAGCSTPRCTRRSLSAGPGGWARKGNDRAPQLGGCRKSSRPERCHTHRRRCPWSPGCHSCVIVPQIGRRCTGSHDRNGG